MKMKILKLFMLPVVAFTLASAAAVTTTSSHKSKAVTTTMQGYIHNPTINDCEPVTVECEPGIGEACLASGWTVYGFDTPVTCNLDLKRI